MWYDYFMISITFILFFLRFFIVENDSFDNKYIEESESDDDPDF